VTNVDPLLNSPLNDPFRAAHEALLALTPPETAGLADDAPLPDIVEHLEYLVGLARDTAATHLGPKIGWARPRSAGNDWTPDILQVDLDGYTEDDPRDTSHINDWETSALALAARAYRRECRWDHSPDEAGIWLLAVAPYSSWGGGGQTQWVGNLTGFVIIHDRDMDGEYESLAHLWTAREWRRRGIGANLVQHARERFPLREVEGPVTDGGRLLLEACAPDLVQ
jgi:GNAT superfamily N-acetyltransferase